MSVAIRAITRIQDADDAPSLGSGQNGYALTWNNATGAFVATALSGGSGSPGGSNTQIQFNDSGAFGGDAGLVYNKTTDVLTGTGRLVMPIWSPASNGTTALQITRADGSTVIVAVDTTNDYLDLRGGKLKLRGDISSYFEIVNNGSSVSFQSYNSTPITFQNAGGGAITFGSNVTFSAVVTLSGTTLTIGGGNGLTISAASASAKTIQSFNNTPLVLNPIANMVGVGNVTPTALLDIDAGTTARASLRIRNGVAPTSPNNGEIWFDGTDLKIRIGGVTKTFTVT